MGRIWTTKYFNGNPIYYDIIHSLNKSLTYKKLKHYISISKMVPTHLPSLGSSHLRTHSNVYRSGRPRASLLLYNRRGAPEPLGTPRDLLTTPGHPLSRPPPPLGPPRVHNYSPHTAPVEQWRPSSKL